MTAWLFAVHLARAGTSWAVPGSAWTLDVDAAADPDVRRIAVMTSAADCRNGQVAEVDVASCVPSVDPVGRTLRLGLQMRATADDAPLASAISPSRLKVSLQTDGGARALSPEEVRLIGHDPLPGEQLVILVVDRSGSMYQGAPGQEPMVKVARALLQSATKARLLPDERSGVILLAFNDRLTAMVTRSGSDGVPGAEPGGEGDAQLAEVMVSPERYAAATRRLLHEDGGYTHLFDAVSSVIDDVLPQPHVRDFVARTESDPVVVLITDGFNNTSASQTCGDNAAPLVDLLQRLREAQQRPGFAPVVHTVGFGRPYYPDHELIPDDNALTGASLCGPDRGRRIDGDLENQGIDNPTLAYLARAGGGQTLVTEDPLAVARFLLTAGKPRHRWYELQLQLPPANARHFRSRLPVRVDVLGVTATPALVTFVPHGLFDLPGDDASAVGALWVLRGVGVSLALLLGLVGLGHLRRAVWRRGALAGRAAPGRGG